MGKLYAKPNGSELMQWPILNQLQELGIFAPLDLYFARRAAHYLGGLAEEEAAILAITMAAARQGHLCLDRDTNIFSLQEDKSESVEKRIQNSCQQLLEKGFIALKENPNRLKPFLHQEENRYYLPKNWALEETLRYHLSRLVYQYTCAPTLPEFPLQAKLNSEQKAAVLTVLTHRLTLLTGGPGTGKTYTAAAIVQAFLYRTNHASRPVPKICLTAPTARAADHLKKKLVAAGIDTSYLQYAGTLHGLLGYKNTQAPAEVPWLDADLVIVDECSMIDAVLFVSLLAGISEKSTVVLMGDPNQLHPVGIGSLFSDLVCAELSLPLGRAHLQYCLRVDQRPLLELTHALEHDQPCKWPLLDWKIDHQNQEDFYKNIWEFTASFWTPPTSHIPERDVLLQQLGRFRVLSVLRQGPFGTEALNRWLAACVYRQVKEGDWWLAPIQITRNDAATGLCNGELGILVQPWQKNFSDQQAEGHAFFLDRDLPIPIAILPAYEYAFCTSVHKSQGSEYEEVLLVVPPGSETFGREMLYTGITRAKSKLHIASTEEILAKVQKRRLRKLSGFRAQETSA